MEVPYTTFSIRVTDPLSQKKTKLQAPRPTPPLEKIKLAAKNGEPLYTLKYLNLLQIFGHRI